MIAKKGKLVWANTFEVLNIQEKEVEMGESSKDNNLTVSIHNILDIYIELKDNCLSNVDNRNKGKGKLGEDVDTINISFG